MKDVLTLSHSDSVSGLTIFDDGTKMYWSEGPGVEVQLIHADGRMETGFEDNPYVKATENGFGGPGRGMTAAEEAEYDVTRAYWSVYPKGEEER